MPWGSGMERLKKKPTLDNSIYWYKQKQKEKKKYVKIG